MYVILDSVDSDLRLELEVAIDLSIMIDTPRSLAVFILLTNGEFEQYLGLDIDPNHYDHHDDFGDDALITKVLSKSQLLPTSFNKEAEAMSSFWNAELVCAYQNMRTPTLCPVMMAELRGIIYQIVGDLNGRKLRKIEANFRNGGGATLSTAGMGSVPSDKYRDRPSLTYALIPYARSIFGDRYADSVENFDVVSGNKFSTVPKNSKTHRGICVEPSLNMVVQLGIGTYLKSCLSRFGVDLYDQTNNQKLAERGVTSDLATIDLSMASDTLSLSVVKSLFPDRWVELLLLARSPCTTLPGGKEYELEKFSSMGNGYTFELETIVFLAIAIYCNGKEFDRNSVSVYGDDIIVPSRIAPKVVETLKLFGFSVNVSKSFLAGRFRESCGADYYDSVPVRPFFLKRSSSSKIPYAVQACNAIRKYAHMRSCSDGCDPRFRPLWMKIRKRVPKSWSHPVPYHFGDTGLIVSDLEHQCFRPQHGEEGYVVKHVTLRPVKAASYDHALLLSHLHRIARRKTHVGKEEDLSFGNRETVRGYLGRPRTSKAITKWPSGFRWEFPTYTSERQVA
jgi:hypothetical protein